MKISIVLVTSITLLLLTGDAQAQQDWTLEFRSGENLSYIALDVGLAYLL